MKFPETARRITEAMNDVGINAQELSKRSGVGKSSISHYVNGSNEPHNENAGKLAIVLKVAPMWLMGYDVDKHQPDTTMPHVNYELNAIIDKLNPAGVAKLIERAEELTEMERYRKE